MKIFWRIFLAFWLASIAIMFATAYVVIHTLEGARVVQQHRENVSTLALQLIEYYEAGDPMPRRLHRRPSNDIDQPPTNPHQRPPRSLELKIIAEDGTPVFQRHFRDTATATAMQIPLTSASGQHYTIFTTPPGLPRFFKETITRTYSLQFVFILIFSTLVSAVLSWSITQPLKKLGRYSRFFAQGDNAEIDAQTLKRNDELGDLAKDLDYMSKTIKATLASQQQLLHDVSHELRAPLARLQASVALVEKDNSTSSHTERMHRECERINALIQQILDFSRLTQDTEKQTQTDLIVLINELLESLAFEFQKRAFHFTPSITTCMAEIFPEALQGALENILRNACKYTPPDTPINITLTNEPRQIILILRDHGPGLDESELEKVLQPFYRSGNQMHTEGFGLGLSISQKAIKKHKGELKLRNHPEGGLEVIVILPRL